MYIGAFVGVVDLDVIVKIDLSLAICRHGLKIVTIDGSKHGEVIPKHAAIAVPVFSVNPHVDPGFRLCVLEELCPRPDLIGSFGEPFSPVAFDGTND